ncbi:MAG: acyl-CoA dehydratase activase [Synergistaceae bacterium]|jgi:predicted CoA-substrate-specific enzyme activase|nr:acyl-CoA dehydratase activase [Synergistaceae bacterium]
MSSALHVGFDIGSTTAKSVVLDDDDRIIHSRYCRHFADIRATVGKLISEIQENFQSADATIAVTGSGALALAEGTKFPFAQELVACAASIGRYLTKVDVAVELGGEDAKLTFFDVSGADQRMNETCAGGTGAFIDQMAALLGTDAAGLNELAKGHENLYPMASRCGVFAKTDVQTLLNEGAARSDIAASIFQAIVGQTISGLACGRKIAGRVAFLGGPLYFLSELRARFMETLCLREDQCVFPENSHLFVAIGAAILGKKIGKKMEKEMGKETGKRSGPVNFGSLREIMSRFASSSSQSSSTQSPSFPPSESPPGAFGALFADEQSREEFKKRHSACDVKRMELSGYSGDAYLGLDGGSTTTKAVLIGEGGELLFSRYRRTGDLLETVKGILTELYSAMPAGVRIRGSGVTGYGERLIRTAFGVDLGEVETVAHARAAEFVLPGVDFVIDIGGQDMKCFGVRDGVITRVFLNEACSSGCGSFLQSFAEAQGLSLQDFVEEAERSPTPVDLGSRCTVFMNSRVRQAQKEGVSVRDIAAGLVYSVVRNALYKVLKLKSADDLGEKIVVQGGTFKNDALLRAFEIVTGREVVRPGISELMGALGMALIAREEKDGEPSRLLDETAVQALAGRTSAVRCSGCGNKCLLIHTTFGDGRTCVSGSRCEKWSGEEKGKKKRKIPPPNLFEKKYKRLFDAYRPLPESLAARGVMGIPRVLNMYEDYPFWFTFLTSLGFRVELSSPRPDEALGMDTVPSQALCYPAKLVHRHVTELLRRGVKRIFYPILLRERREFPDAHQHFNCPVVVGYPDVAALNIDWGDGVEFMRPTLSFDYSLPGEGILKEELVKQLYREFSRFGVSFEEVEAAFGRAKSEQSAYRADIRKFGDEALAVLEKNGETGIVLAGHPYHLDPEVHHGIPDLVTNCGVAVFTEDSICHKVDEIGGTDPLYVVDQWAYHSRLYRAASVVARHPGFANVYMVQLNSFGCGLDAISVDQVADLLERYGKIHAMIRIDEGANTGAAKIRIRSLLASVKSRKTFEPRQDRDCPKPMSRPGRRAFSSKNARTILCPPLSAYHFHFLQTVMREEGLDFRVLPEGGRGEVELGLKYVNNDICYPSMMVVGQFLKALSGGEYDPDKTDCLYAQTGGVCRASNYMPLLRRALDSAGFRRTRILAVNSQGGEGTERFTPSLRSVWRSLTGLLYGDMLMRLLCKTRPCELEQGSAKKLYDDWVARCDENLRRGKWRVFKEDMRQMVRDFAALPVDPSPRPRVGIVGEILVKYHAGANDGLIDLIEAEGGEAVVPDLAGFLLYCLFNGNGPGKFGLGQSLKEMFAELFPRLGVRLIEYMRNPMREALRGTRFGEVHNIRDMARKAMTLVSPANQAGEGWLLVAEILQLIESGTRNILCVQPFACLPNHITGRGILKELKRLHRDVNVLALDYDASASNVNQLNRIKLLMATARAD